MESNKNIGKLQASQCKKCKDKDNDDNCNNDVNHNDDDNCNNDYNDYIVDHAVVFLIVIHCHWRPCC